MTVESFFGYIKIYHAVILKNQWTSLSKAVSGSQQNQVELRGGGSAGISI